ncbi:CapA family protein [Arthrobacter sp. ES3-54]|uniref:CapA family protein n=1 Tax=Arthrobacter sp. ES3-54 TaxID=1502991 RepID=UPI002406FA34|nr:CapA family protein [Arthrobacter sp. ES3-54]MDF9752839.1 poly-gamma-glutamate capsule biosynthesis protein CapA/YwtB (metallophosphatase superfamily) [Arthrobacter sp. ES3-54]
MQIALLGDVMLGRLVNQHLATVRPAYPWGDTLELLRQADVRIANLECVLASGGEPEPGKVFHFRSDPKNVASLLAAGIDVVSLANNHVLDFGQDAFREMLPALDGRGILHAGAGPDLDAARRPAVRRVDGAAVGFIAFTDNEPGWEAGAATPGVYYVPVDDGGRRRGGAGSDGRLDGLLALVRRTKARVQFLIVSAHWGGNWGHDAPARHQDLARDLIDAGADLVFGHSPHIFRGVGSHRNRPIIYSAGDFIDDYAVDPVERNDQSFVFMLDTDGNSPRTLRLYPTIIAGFQARLARGSAPDIAARMQRLSSHLGTLSTWNASGRCLEIPLDKPARG